MLEKKNTLLKLLLCFWLTLFLGGLIGCAQPEFSGFLEPYEGFEKVKNYSANLEFVREEVVWQEYKAVRIAQVVTYVEAQNGYRAVNPDDLEHMTDLFEASLIEVFSQNYEVTTEEGPDVLDVRAAITRLRPTSQVANVASWVVPGNLVIRTAYTAATNTNLALGEAGIEVEFANSVTGVREYGFVGLNMGSAIGVEQISRWGIAERALEEWASLLAERLQSLKSDDAASEDGL